MLIKSTNIEERLRSIKKGRSKEDELLREVYNVLNNTTDSTSAVLDKLTEKPCKRHNELDFDLLDTSRIFHVNHIKETCITYRLRFLDSKYFKGTIPEEAIEEIKNIERQHATTLDGFKIMAPSKLFKLEDKDDPLLFIPINNDYYYLIHKWGKDLHPLRKVLVWPFLNMINLMILILLVSLIASSLVPSGLFSKKDGLGEFMVVFFFMFKSVAAVVLFYGVALGKNFNPAIWNSKFYNA